MQIRFPNEKKMLHLQNQSKYLKMTLKAAHIRKAFGDNLVLKDASLELISGKVTVLMGANGSGKTTLFNIFTGFLKKDEGLVSVVSDNHNFSLDDLAPYQIQRMGVGRTFQDLRLVNSLTVKENVMLAFPEQEGDNWWNTLIPLAQVEREQRDLSKKADEILATTFLTKVSGSLAGEISYGEQKLLNLACCIAGGTGILLLDEPVAGVNPVYREKLKGVISALKEEGKAILIIEHNADFINEIADEILFLNEGVIKEYDSYEEFRSDEYVKNAYV